MADQHVVSPPAVEEREQEEVVQLNPKSNPIKDIQNGSLSNEREAFYRVVDFVKAAVAQPYCRSLSSGRQYAEASRCTCLHALRPHPSTVDGVPDDLMCRMVAAHVCYFGSLAEPERRRTEIEWIRAESLYPPPQEGDNRRFFLSIRSPDYISGDYPASVLSKDEYSQYLMATDSARSPRVCANALRLIYALGQHRWTTSKNAAKTNTFPVHQLKGRKGKNSNKKNADAQETEDAVVAFLQAVADDNAEVPATRMVRCMTGQLRKEEEGLLELPLHFTKRSLHVRFCLERGWKISNDALMKECKTPRTDDGWNADDTPKPIVSWPRFLTIWDERLPKLRIRAKGEDICGECAVVSMRFKYRSFRRFLQCVEVPPETDPPELIDLFSKYKREFGVGATNAEMEAGEGDDSSSEETEDSLANQGDDDDDDPVLQEANLKLLEQSFLHVKAYNKQRQLHNRTVEVSMQSIVDWQVATALSWLYPVPLSPPPMKLRYLLKVAFTADYCQNLNIPYLGAEQVGEAYYYSPLNADCFGIADQMQPFDLLDAFVYMDHTTGKGGNQVASLIYKFLKAKGLINKDDPIGEISVTFDNCAGQNKNMIVLGLFAWLVEQGYFHRVNLVFLVRGHTKNACDRMFNILKKSYRKQNIYSTEQLLKSLNVCTNVHACLVAPDEFKDWKKATASCYKTPDGKVKNSQNFKYNKDKPGILTISKFDGEPEEDFVCHKRIRKQSREDALAANFPPKALPILEMAPIRRVEMWSKWKPLVPEDHRVDEWFVVPPSADQVAKVKRDKQSSKSKRKAEKISTAAPAAASTPPTTTAPPTASL